MRLLKFNSIGGASGDMMLASLFALGVDKQKVTDTLKTLDIEDFSIDTEKVNTHGISGVQTTVKAVDCKTHRFLSDIKDIIESGSLSTKVKELSLAVFNKLAEAEAVAHGTTPDKIHFHEVGAMDSIIDIIGTCIAIDMLDIDSVAFDPLPLGSGTVRCAHGIMPLPAPATSVLLKNYNVTFTDEPYELVTPTGASLLTVLSEQLAASAISGKILNIGNAIGHRELKARPNLLRAILLETEEPTDSDTASVIETNIDDMSPELIGELQSKLLKIGALDAFVTPILMKKQRPSFLLTALCKDKDKQNIVEVIFNESSTFGIREYTVKRYTLERRIINIKTDFGDIRVKQGFRNGQLITQSPEFEDCKKVAHDKGVTLKSVYDSVFNRLEPLH